MGCIGCLLCSAPRLLARECKGKATVREREVGRERRARQIHGDQQVPTTETRHGFTDNKVAATSSTFREPTNIPVNGSIVYCLYSQRVAERKETKGSSREPRDSEPI